MTFKVSLKKLLDGLLALGARRLAILGASGLLIFAGTGLGGYLLSRPAFELLYAGLDRQDVTRIGAALRDANIMFDVSADGTNVMVAAGQTSRARMLLAEKGLPHSANVGYELFDKMGSLGLTSFMQDVTRVRALEGELGRTILTMNGIRSARVHLVMPDEGSFRRARQSPSASVVIRPEGRADMAMARAIRHLVASSIAGMGVEAVTVLTTDGETLASGNESDLTASGSVLNLERTLSDNLKDNIRRTLAPYLGLQNLQVSVTARLNTDRRQTNETIFNPESRVERSVRTVKESQSTQNSLSQSATSVDRNIPGDRKTAGDGKQSSDDSQKREEITNYEVSSKQIATTSGGYAVDHLDVAVLVNSEKLGAASTEEQERRLTEIKDLAAAAAGLRRDRGDIIKVSAVAFQGVENHDAAGLMATIAPALARQTGSFVNALAAVAVVALIMLFGAKPLLRFARTPDALPQLAASEPTAAPLAAPADEPKPALEFTEENPRRAAKRRLEALIASDEQATVALLQHWIRSEQSA